MHSEATEEFVTVVEEIGETETEKLSLLVPDSGGRNWVFVSFVLGFSWVPYFFFCFMFNKNKNGLDLYG